MGLFAFLKCLLQKKEGSFEIKKRWFLSPADKCNVAPGFILAAGRLKPLSHCTKIVSCPGMMQVFSALWKGCRGISSTVDCNRNQHDEAGRPLDYLMMLMFLPVTFWFSQWRAVIPPPPVFCQSVKAYEREEKPAAPVSVGGQTSYC